MVDRLKNIFKLSQGEYVAPEKLEQVYARSSLATQVFVDGSPLRSYPVALVVPDGAAVAKALNEAASKKDAGSPSPASAVATAAIKSKSAGLRIKNKQTGGGDSTGLDQTPRFVVCGKAVTLADLCNASKYPEAEKLIHEDLTQLGKTAGLKGFEQVRSSFVSL